MSKFLTPEDFKILAVAHDLDVKLIRAVALVESAGHGFLPSGRVKILFERHIMRRQLHTHEIDPLALMHFNGNLCATSAGGYKGGEGEWDRVSEVLRFAALRHDALVFEKYKKATYESCSWGLMQLMGFNYHDAGFPNVYEMKHTFELSEAEQLGASLKWANEQLLLGHLRSHDWAGFARGYNGANYARNKYDRKLREAYESLD